MTVKTVYHNAGAQYQDLLPQPYKGPGDWTYKAIWFSRYPSIQHWWGFFTKGYRATVDVETEGFTARRSGHQIDGEVQRAFDAGKPGIWTDKDTFAVFNAGRIGPVREWEEMPALEIRGGG